MAFDMGVPTLTRRPAGGPLLAGRDPAEASPRWLLRAADAADRNVFVVVVLAFAGAIVALSARGEIQSDSWYALVSGRLVGRSWVPHTDTLTVLSQGREWVDQQWLSHLALYGLWSAGGWPLALLALDAMFLTAFTLAAAAARSRGATALATAMVAVPCLLLGLGNIVFRAQTPAYVLFALVLLLVLEDERRPSRRVFFCLPLLALWANVHGSVLLGAGLVALRGAALLATTDREALRRSAPRAAALLALPWLCTLVSPYGLALPGYYARVLDNGTLGRFASEWQPPTIKDDPVFFLALAAAIWLVARRGAAAGTTGKLALVASGAAGLLASRNVVWFALVALAVVPRTLDGAWSSRPAPRRRRANLSIAGAALVALAGVAGASAAHPRSWFEADYPARAGDAVAAAAASGPALKVFANERYADWLLFEHPELAGRVAYDARFELLRSDELAQVAAFRRQQGAGWSRIAEGYGLVVLDASGERSTVRRLASEPGTRVVFRDDAVAVLQRAPS